MGNKRIGIRILAAGLSGLLAATIAAPASGFASGTSAVAAAAASAPSASRANDIEGHWAQSELEKWLAEGKLKGYDDGNVHPNDPVRRSELAALINRAFGLQGAAASGFKDIKPGSWEYSTVATAVYAGYAGGYEDGTFRPSAKVTRQEAAVMLASASGSKGGAEAPAAFADADKLASWSRAAVASLVAQGVLNGYKDGTFRPGGNLTRAEAIVAIGKAAQAAEAAKGTLYSSEGVYGPLAGSRTLKGDVSVTAPGVTIRNTVVEGDLVLGEGIGEGDVFLAGVAVKGTTYVRGGGLHSVHIQNGTLSRVFVEKKGSPVRIAASGGTVLDELTFRSSTAGSRLELSAGTTVGKLVLDAPIDAKGKGVIKEARLGADASASKFETAPQALSGAGVPTPSPSSAPIVGGGGFFPVPVPTPTPGPTATVAPTPTPGPTATVAPTPTPGPTATVAPTLTPRPTATVAPTPTPAPTTSPEGRLSSLSIGGYELKQWPIGYGGFNPEVAEYKVTLPLDYVSGSLEVKAEAKSGLLVTGQVNNVFGELILPESPVVDGKFSYDQTRRQVNEIRLAVKNPAGDTVQGYTVTVSYERTLAEKMTAKPGGYFEVQDLKPGDLIRLYANEGDTNPVAEAVSEKNFAYLSTQLFASTGTVWVSLNKGSKESYAYDLTTLSEGPADGLTARQLTDDELKGLGPYFRGNFGFELLLNGQPLSVSEAVYVTAEEQDAQYSGLPNRERGRQLQYGDYSLSKANAANKVIYSRLGIAPQDFDVRFGVYLYDAEQKVVGYTSLFFHVKVSLSPSIVDGMIASLPQIITLGDKDKVRDVRTAYSQLSQEERSVVKFYFLLVEAEAKIQKLMNPSQEDLQTVSLTLDGLTLDKPFSPENVRYIGVTGFGNKKHRIKINLEFDSDKASVEMLTGGSVMTGQFHSEGKKEVEFEFNEKYMQYLSISLYSKTGLVTSYYIELKNPYLVNLTSSGFVLLIGIDDSTTVNVYKEATSDTPYTSAKGSGGMALVKYADRDMTGEAGGIWISIAKQGAQSDKIRFDYDFSPLKAFEGDYIVATDKQDMLELLQSFPGSTLLSYTTVSIDLSKFEKRVRYISEGITPDESATVQDAVQTTRISDFSQPYLYNVSGQDPRKTSRSVTLFLYDENLNPIGYNTTVYPIVYHATPRVVTNIIDQILKYPNQSDNVKIARAAYELLTAEQKALVTNVAVLTRAEAELNQP